MIVFHQTIQIDSEQQVTFDDITDHVAGIIEESGASDGIVTVFSQHTSCSVFIQEDSDAVTYKNIPLILQDTINCLEKIIPTCEFEGQYLHPGPYHIELAQKLRQEEPAWGLNTDGHIKSSILGRSETIPIVDSRMTLGDFGRIYFADWDKTRARSRTVRIQILGQ